MQIAIVCASDNNFALPMMVMLSSAVINLDKNSIVDIYIIDSGILEKNRQRIEHLITRYNNVNSLSFLNKNLEDSKNLYATSAINKTTYLRILLPNLLPNLEKVIYLDSDLIVEDDLTKIWSISFDGCLAMGIQDYYFPTVSSNEALENYKELRLNTDTPFCNAGVIVMNLAAWRVEDIGNKIMNYCETTNQNDQQGINAILAGRWKLIDPRWNVTLSSLDSFKNTSFYRDLSLEEVRETLLSKPGILHYTSRFKPWHLGLQRLALINNYYSQNQRSRFYFYLKMSGWFNPLHFSLWLWLRKSILFFGMKLPHQVKNMSLKLKL